MPLGLTLARGDWESRWFATTSSATFPKGALVNLSTTHLLVEWASDDSSFLGIALSHSTASTPIGGLGNSVQVAIPAPNCTAFADLGTGFTTSLLSIGQRVSSGIWPMEDGKLRVLMKWLRCSLRKMFFSTSEQKKATFQHC